jgi:hypothetical protein
MYKKIEFYPKRADQRETSIVATKIGPLCYHNGLKGFVGKRKCATTHIPITISHIETGLALCVVDSVYVEILCEKLINIIDWSTLPTMSRENKILLNEVIQKEVRSF